MNSRTPAEQPRISAANRRYIDYETRLFAICDRIHETERLEMALDEIQPGLLGMFDAERITVFERTGDGRALTTRFCTVPDAEPHRLPLGLTSVPGFVAMSQQTAVIHDVYDHEQLQALHENLSFDYERDQAAGLFTRSVMAVPIASDDSILGVLELANKLTGSFSSQGMAHLGRFLMSEKLGSMGAWPASGLMLAIGASLASI